MGHQTDYQNYEEIPMERNQRYLLGGGGHCLVTWQKLTTPKINGGLGIIDIELQNKALLLKWI
jgi:hypothetical protein